MSTDTKSLDELCVNTIRTLSIDAVQAAESGHPGMPMGMADAAYVLWTHFLKHDPQHPRWFDRDRFVLSAGHGSMLLYSLLHLTGYDLPLEEIRNFRQWNSKTPGHPEYGHTEGVETTTGPLGQGFATGVGMAMAEAHLAERFNTGKLRLVDHYTYGIVSDGDLMEGISHEAASLAGHLKLGKLIYLYDSNRISIDGSTDLTFTEKVGPRFEAYGWHTVEVDGHDRQEVEQAIRKAQAVSDRPSLVICRTHIGYGSPNQQDSADAHGSPLGEEEVERTKRNLGWEYEEKFYVPPRVKDHFRKALDRGADSWQTWQTTREEYGRTHPEKSRQFEQYLERRMPEAWDELVPAFEAGGKMATRAASGSVLDAVTPAMPSMIGGSADLTGSNKTWIEEAGVFGADNYGGRNIHYGVREHAMAAAMNGMALHGGVIPYGGTFLIFSDYCRPAIRIAALSGIPSIFVMTHDSIGLGEDGPTHQPVEHLASLRAMPNILVLRPMDANEVRWAWKAALEHTGGPSLLVLTRQGLPVIARNDDNDASGLMRGAYVVADSEKEVPDAILIGTGSEVQLALEARELLKEEDVDARVVSMPSWELFEAQEAAYRASILPPQVKARVSVEAAATFGWERWTGDRGTAVGLDRFGASAPYEDIFENLGITPDRIAREAIELYRSLD